MGFKCSNIQDFFQQCNEQVPCSFQYNNVNMQEAFGALCPAGGEDGYQHYTRKLEHTDRRLFATLHIRRYQNAVEWWITLEANSEYDTDVISDYSFAALTVETDKIDMCIQTEFPCLHYANGSRAAKDDFAPFSKNFWPFPKDPYHFCCDGGRSSSSCMPYFNLQLSRESGVIFAIGWSGQWHLNFGREDEADLTGIVLNGQLEKTNFRLLAGEKLEMPHMLAFYWEGRLTDSFNQFRSFMLKEAELRQNRLDRIPASFAAWGGVDYKTHLNYIDLIRAHNIPANTYWIDAGWFGEGDEQSDDCYRDNWYFNVGAWNALPNLYPNGLSEVSDAARTAGLDFLLWFEAERAVSRLSFVAQHRDYYIGPKLPFDEKANHETNSTPFSLMLNLGYEPARRWITDVLSGYIESLDMKVLRIDFNYHPLPYWQYADATDRQGVSEIKYVQGLYTMLDELIERFPNLAIDNCASGGRRLDYEMCRRSIPLFRTDYFCTPDHKAVAVQTHTNGISRWLPIHGASAGGENAHHFSTYYFRSHMAAAIAIDAPDPAFPLTQAHLDWYAEMFTQARRAQAYFTKDYYPLTGCTQSDLDWYAYQMHDRETNAGFVMAFRRASCATAAIDVFLEAIDVGTSYLVEDADTIEVLVESGFALKSLHLEIEQTEQSKLLFYKRIES